MQSAVEGVLADRGGVPEDLKAIALALAAVLDTEDSFNGVPPAKAPIAKELRATLAAIDMVTPKKVVSVVDDLASARASRRSAAKSVDKPAAKQQRRPRGGRSSA